MGNIKYPPKMIYSPSKLNKLNYDLIILWMLKNNDICEWADFKKEPIEIPTGTLSRHIDKLKRKGFIERFKRGHYRITSEGKKRFYILSSAKKREHKLNYPPKIILKSGRNYADWILWMLYNNSYCKRSDFIEDPLSINQSSLSKNLNLLNEKGFIKKEEKKYVISYTGKAEYSRMLQNYNLDRQTILEEEGKRIEDVTYKTTKFFEMFRIKDKNVQFRFLNNILTLDYEKVKPLLKDEEIFHKIILYLSINHPDNYPYFISSEEYSKKYKIKKTTLDYYITEISEGKIYPSRFFKLTLPSGEQYFFQSDGRLERILRVITEDEIKKATYLNKLFSKPTPDLPALDMNTLRNEIVNKSCEFLFNKDLAASLREFLPKYIIYLAYEIEARRELKESLDKLEGYIWHNISDIYQSQFSGNLVDQYQNQKEKIDNEIEIRPENIELYYQKIRILIYFNKYQETITFLESMLELFPESEKDIKILKADVLRKMQNIKTGLDIINELIQKYPQDNDLICYKAYWMQYLDNKEEAIKIIHKLIKKEPDNGLYQETYGEILMYFEDYEEAAKRFLKAIMVSSDAWYIYQTYIKLGICHKALENYDLALKNLKKGKQLTKKSSIDSETKQKWLSIADLFMNEINQYL